MCSYGCKEVYDYGGLVEKIVSFFDLFDNYFERNANLILSIKKIIRELESFTPGENLIQSQTAFKKK